MQRAFSLIELVIVVVIIGVIAAIAVPRVTEASRNAAAAGIAAHLRRMAAAFELYHAEHGAWPPSAVYGAMPTEMAGRIDPGAFGPTPAGGEYRWFNFLSLGSVFGGCQVTMYDPTGDPLDWDLVARVDALLDDGDPVTGAFVRHTINWVDANGVFASLRLATQ